MKIKIDPHLYQQVLNLWNLVDLPHLNKNEIHHNYLKISSYVCTEWHLVKGICLPCLAQIVNSWWYFWQRYMLFPLYNKSRSVFGYYIVRTVDRFLFLMILLFLFIPLVKGIVLILVRIKPFASVIVDKENSIRWYCLNEENNDIIISVSINNNY